ncbi:MAG: hypothetical protein K8F52_00970 [Candidatus Scalindua rubra]|uniref:Uncharacterized protein n=1 Tax=Candidatus Scalindua brodae TaxID=237368 RepID=A0A0B0EIU1_9BACT|nr:MAG: hypothetical protein SCABRO_02300 [Candidatus Scalindua brodae]MBZ0107212.1 hypothetical protein [Candidatus Scalindua rubra]TWU31651.1 hypothetical protein S225a_20420 [Candidatus Brocadiaceae bacterium S225]
MIRQRLAVIGFKSSINIAVIVFFASCIIGYASNLAIDTLIQKAVIAGCLTGLTAFVLVKILVKYVPENIGMVEDRDNEVGTS